jgi:hypothetical protein
LGKAKSETVPRWLVAAAFGAVVLYLIGHFSGEIFDPDFWWHLRTGQYLVQQHRLPVPDPFSYTTATAPPGYPGEEHTRYFNLTHEWLAEAAGYGVFSVGGFPAIVLLRALLMAAACLMTGWITGRRTRSWWWGLGAALAASSVAEMFATDRPNLVSYLFVMVFVACLEWRRALWLLPVLAIVWANCHGGFFLAWIVCGAYCAEAVLRRDPLRNRLLLISGIVVLVSGANPNGFGIVPTLWRYRQSYMTSLNLEWRHADLWGVPYGYDLLLFASIPVLALAWRRVRPADWLLFAFFAYASLTAFRNEIYFGLFAPILIATYFPVKWRLPMILRYAAVGALAAAIAWGAVRGPYFQFRAGEWRYPAGAVDFLRAHELKGPIFNTFLLGGYLIWRGESVFIDGRSLSETVFKDYMQVVYSPPGDAARPEVLARYGIQSIVMDSFNYYTGAVYPLVRALAADPLMLGWKLVYEDPRSMIFVRNPPAGLPDLGRRRVSDHVESECRLLLANDPKYPGCAKYLGELFRAGNPARARRMLELYFEHGGSGDAEARQWYAELGGR